MMNWSELRAISPKRYRCHLSIKDSGNIEYTTKQLITLTPDGLMDMTKVKRDRSFYLQLKMDNQFMVDGDNLQEPTDLPDSNDSNRSMPFDYETHLDDIDETNSVNQH